MAKPMVELYTRDDCRNCLCPFARAILRAFVSGNRCDAKELNLSILEQQDPYHPAIKYARAHGYHLPTFLVKHPKGNLPERKVQAHNRDDLHNGKVRDELNVAITAVWKVP